MNIHKHRWILIPPAFLRGCAICSIWSKKHKTFLHPRTREDFTVFCSKSSKSHTSPPQKGANIHKHRGILFCTAELTTITR